MNHRQKGDYSELLVLAELAKQERRIAIPYGNSEGFDLLVQGRDGSWKMLQIKTAYKRGKRGNRVYVDTIRRNGPKGIREYPKGSFDFLIAVLPEESRFWVISFREMFGRTAISLPDSRDSGWGML